VAPEGEFESSHRYLQDTNVLETEFQSSAGSNVKLTDFMPIHRRTSHRLGHDVGTSRQILRLVEAREKPCTVEVRFKPTFNFAQDQTELSLADHKGAIARHRKHLLMLYGPKLGQTRIEDGTFYGQLSLRPGERAWLVLCLADSVQGMAEGFDPDVSVRNLERTAEYWRAWASHCAYKGRYREAVVRSALTLKLLIYEPTGAVVAAPTTSLPERVGGVRNWDYRFSWLRDSSLMLFALSTLGYHEEATDFIMWLAGICLDNPIRRPQIVYTLEGDRELPEVTLDQLDGYRGSQPVRIGNGAADQNQLDIYGEILSAAYHFHHTSENDPATPIPEPGDRLSRRAWRLLSFLVDQAVDCWQEPDSGIWEVRGGPRHFTYSKLMCWVAVDRAIRFAEEQKLRAPLERWRQACRDIRQTILERGYNAEVGAFTQVLDGKELDASLLAIPRVGFLPSSDPRVQSTVDRIREQLTKDGLVERYHADDGLPGSEGTFALCSFWMVDALAYAGRTEEARELFEHLLEFTNDVGLMAEEIDPHSTTDKLLGNFPQGFSHMALIGAAVNLAYAEKHGADVAALTEPERAQQLLSARRA
jgi:GH15 family glucan-1,4-alpha-glucosidase